MDYRHREVLMSGDFNTFCEDLAYLSSEEFDSKYDSRIPVGIKIADVVSYLSSKGLAERFIRSDWKGDGQDMDDIYLIKNGVLYEMFVGERGGKQWKKVFGDLESALFSWLDRVFHNLRYTAPDTKIK